MSYHNNRWLVGATAALVLSMHGAAVAAPADIDGLIVDQLKASGAADVFVKMKRNAILEGTDGLASKAQKAQYVYDTLTSHADEDQRALRGYLAADGVKFRVFWINNSILIRDASPALVAALARRDDVDYLRGNHSVPLHRPEVVALDSTRLADTEWGIEKINAPAVWATGNTGQGVVVANIDTGVRYTHQAVVNAYRGNNGNGTYSHDYNWYDPSNTFPNAPGDNNDHGTHTMGTMVGGDGLGAGSNDIGVAPGAKWIAAKGCESFSCSDASLIAAAQWIVCPTRLDGVSAPDCSKAPDVVNNSWGGGGGNSWYATYAGAWFQAGIIPVFSIGNSGPSCNTAGSPGDYRFVLGVGGTDINDSSYNSTSKGPGTFRPLKPDFGAPGENVRSSTANSNSSYATFSGTSMAAPHLVGTIALMLAENPAATFGPLYNALRTTAFQGMLAPNGTGTCGGRSYNVYPNFIYGFGRIDASAAVQAIQ